MSSRNSSDATFGRFRACAHLAVAILLMVACIKFIYIWRIPVLEPVGLYHYTWEKVAENIYDPNQLPNWQSWEHKFDNQIHSDDDAIKYANQMITAAGDRYTRLMSRQEVEASLEEMQGQFTGVGIAFEPKLDANNKVVFDKNNQVMPNANADGYPLIDQVIPNSPAAKAGLKAGDALTAIETQSAKDINLPDLTKLIRGRAGTDISLTYLRDGQESKVSVKRGTVKMPIVTSKLLPDNIGYIRYVSFATNSGASDFMQALEQLQDAKALIVDLRGNPGGFLQNAVTVSALFIEKGTLFSQKTRVPGDPKNPQYQTWTIALTDKEIVQTLESPTGTKTSKQERPPYLASHRPVIILVDDGSASAAELTTAAIAENGAATVMGNKTFGKGIGQYEFPHANGTRLHITTFRYFTPKGNWLGDGCNTECHGIQPDVPVNPDVKHFTIGSDQDNQLKSAQKLLSDKLNGK